jgi:hypothetical protein
MCSNKQGHHEPRRYRVAGLGVTLLLRRAPLAQVVGASSEQHVAAVGSLRARTAEEVRGSGLKGQGLGFWVY